MFLHLLACWCFAALFAFIDLRHGWRWASRPRGAPCRTFSILTVWITLFGQGCTFTHLKRQTLNSESRDFFMYWHSQAAPHHLFCRNYKLHKNSFPVLIGHLLDVSLLWLPWFSFDSLFWLHWIIFTTPAWAFLCNWLFIVLLFFDFLLGLFRSHSPHYEPPWGPCGLRCTSTLVFPNRCGQASLFKNLPQ